MLVDIVSKNGNLLLNVVQRPDGSLDPEVEQDLERLAAWIGINGEGIYGTRPWIVHGEGPVRARGGNFKEDFNYTARDIRFTTRGSKTLYAFALGWPDDRQLLIRSLAKVPGVEARIQEVQLLGYAGSLQWKLTADGLQVTLPETKPCDHSVALKVIGDGFDTFQPKLALAQANRLQPGADGTLVLDAESAEIHGQQLRAEAQGGEPNLGFWDNANDWASWMATLKQSGRYRVTASVATVHTGVEFTVEIQGQKLTGQPKTTGAWTKFQTVELGTIELPRSGDVDISIRPAKPADWKAINLRWVKLQPAS